MATNLPRRFRVACIQLNAGSDWRDNAEKILRKIHQALGLHPRLIALPENCYFRGDGRRLGKVSDAVFREFLPVIKETARKNDVSVLLGSVPERSRVPGKFYNTSMLISSGGKIAAQYRKIHLFDIALPNLRAKESDTVQGGRRVITGSMGKIKAGLTICYDLRFPELFRVLTRRGVRLIFVPAHFTHKTGQAHWEVLLRARAIENQVYIIAPNQVGVHPESKILSYGTSLIIDPWGKVIVRGSKDQEQILAADLDFSDQDRLRKSFPVLKSIRLDKIRP